jgi:hypothetical protein
MLPTVDFCGLKVTRLFASISVAGRIDPRMAFEYAFESIKPSDVVNVGMFRGDKDDMVEEDAATVREIPGR